MPDDYLIRCRQCGETENKNLYTEDCYHDVTCGNCGCRTGIYGDENECIKLWNGKGVPFFAVMWQGGYNGKLLELHDDREKADDRAKELNDMIADGTSIHGRKLDISLGIRELVTVEEIHPNKTFIIKGINDEQKKDS
jgi:hypothetical protein